MSSGKCSIHFYSQKPNPEADDAGTAAEVSLMQLGRVSFSFTVNKFVEWPEKLPVFSGKLKCDMSLGSSKTLAAALASCATAASLPFLLLEPEPEKGRCREHAVGRGEQDGEVPPRSIPVPPALDSTWGLCLAHAPIVTLLVPARHWEVGPVDIGYVSVSDTCLRDDWQTRFFG